MDSVGNCKLRMSIKTKCLFQTGTEFLLSFGFLKTQTINNVMIKFSRSDTNYTLMCESLFKLF